MRDRAATRPTERAGRRSLALRDGSARLEAASPVSDALRRLAELVLDARRTVAFTGAGVSTESGIPDFRSPGGLWDRFDPSEFTYQNFMGSLPTAKYWALGRVTYPVIRAARPNGAHLALAELHRLDRLDCCITQNIDDLHQRAGLPAEKVIELHGNATRTRCLACGTAYTRDEVHEWLEERDGLPACPACGGVVKPTTVLFASRCRLPSCERVNAGRGPPTCSWCSDRRWASTGRVHAGSRQARRRHARDREPRADTARRPGRPRDP